ncbi:MAG: cytochrome c [Rubrivivax sp.]
MRGRFGIAAAALAAAAAVSAQQDANAPSASAVAPAAMPSPAPDFVPVPATPEEGRRAYTSFCVRCHGINLAVGSSAYFDLRTFPKDDKARFLNSVTNGKRQMPAWGGIVRPDQMEAIWAYIGSVNGW